jgi:predicted nucleic-acid-binding Zn-ribbon protein
MGDATSIETTCPHCGGNAFESGWLHQTGSGMAVLYCRDGESVGFSGMRGRMLSAKCCESCGYLMIFAEKKTNPTT